jgi:hypothetical protein
MTARIDLFERRLMNQGLVRSRWRTPVEIVSALGAVQAQDYPGARWALGMRAPQLRDSDVELAFDAGAILRTHVMRPTWHFVAPADIRWLLALTGPRVRRAMAYYQRQHDVDAKIVKRSLTVFERALRGGRVATRGELSAALQRAGIDATGQRLAHLVMEAELDALVCSGPRVGKQFTYALVEERVPPAPALDREAALVELVRRYFTSHGPATIRDFVWWSGLTVHDTKAGLALAGEALERGEIDGFECWSAPASTRTSTSRRRPSPEVYLLSNYDEIGIAYKDRGFVPSLARPASLRDSYAFPHQLMIDGALVGAWQRAPSARGLNIDVLPYRTLTRPERSAIGAVAERYAHFLGAPIKLAFHAGIGEDGA